MPKDKLTGDDVIVEKILNKIELALRRIYDPSEPVTWPLDKVADEIHNISKDLWK